MTRMATRRDAPVICLSCGRSSARKERRQKYCSERCRQRGHGRSRKAGFSNNRASSLELTPDTGAPTTPPKLCNKINGLQDQKTGSYPCILAPAVVIDRELFAGRKWERVTSEDGVSCLIARKAA